jgi:hypothetical protein
MKRKNANAADAAPAEKLAEAPSPPAGEPSDFLDTVGLLKLVPFCKGTLDNRRKAGLIPYINSGGRRVIYHWPSVREALLRMQRNTPA